MTIDQNQNKLSKADIKANKALSAYMGNKKLQELPIGDISDPYKGRDFRILKELTSGVNNEGDDTTYSITCGETDENGFADTYRNGKKTNVRMLLFSEEDIERLQAIQVDYPEPPKEKWYKKVLKCVYNFIMD